MRTLEEAWAELGRRGLNISMTAMSTIHPLTVVEGPLHLDAGIDNHAPAVLGCFSYSHSVLPPSLRRLGRYTSIGGGVAFGASNHPSTWLTSSPFTYDARHPPFAKHAENAGRRPAIHDWGYSGEEYGAGISIGNDVWIGSESYIRGGVALGDGCIVGTRAVVTKDVPPFAVVVGNPGRVVKQRFSSALVDDLLELRWWDYDFTSFPDIDWEDASAAVTRLLRLKRAGELEPIVPWAPFGDLLAGLMSKEA